MTSASQVYPRADLDRVVGVLSSSDPSSLFEVVVVVRFLAVEVDLREVEDGFFLPLATTVLEAGFLEAEPDVEGLPPLIALLDDVETGGPFKDCRPPAPPLFRGELA